MNGRVAYRLIGALVSMVVFVGIAAHAQAPSSVAEGLLNEARAAVEARDLDRAVALFQEALRMTPSLRRRAEILNDLGEVYYELERYEEARDAFTQALQIRPDYVRAQANLEVVRWALPPPPRPDETPPERLSTLETAAVQLAGGYVNGLMIGGLFNVGAGILGYVELEGILRLLGAGLVVGATMKVPEMGRTWNYGHGATRNTIAGALLPPAIAVVAVLLRDEYTEADLWRAARIGALFSPIGATLGYTLSIAGPFSRAKHPPIASGLGAASNPFHRRERRVALQLALVRF